MVGVVGPAGHGERSPGTAEELDRLVKSLLVARGDHHPSAIADQALGDAQPDAAARAGDNRGLPNEPAHARRSSTIAMPMPPPTHIDSTANCLSCHCRELISVVVIRAPVIPYGWPIAIAPPFTFSFSSGMPS